MQQVKKQLQDAIKELKSEWGINEVKREDLAAVLDKVVAALDRAAQLPAQPAQPAYVGGVIVAEKKYAEGSGIPIEDAWGAPSDSIPVLYGSRGSSDAQFLMFSPSTRRMYRSTSAGNPLSYEFNNQVVLCGNSIVMLRYDRDGNPLELRTFGSDVYSH